MVDVVETMARAAAEADGEPENWQAWVGNCRAALAAIEAEGFAVVPVEPDDEFWSRVDFHGGKHSRSGETYPVQRNLHRAMIAETKKPDSA